MGTIRVLQWRPSTSSGCENASCFVCAAWSMSSRSVPTCVNGIRSATLSMHCPIAPLPHSTSPSPPPAFPFSRGGLFAGPPPLTSESPFESSRIVRCGLRTRHGTRVRRKIRSIPSSWSGDIKRPARIRLDMGAFDCASPSVDSGGGHFSKIFSRIHDLCGSHVSANQNLPTYIIAL